MRYESSIGALFLAALASSCVAVQAGRAESLASFQANTSAQMDASSSSWNENDSSPSLHADSLGAGQWGSENGHQYSQGNSLTGAGPDPYHLLPGQSPESLPHNKLWGLVLSSPNSLQPNAWGLDSTSNSPGTQGKGWGADASLAWGTQGAPQTRQQTTMPSAASRVPRMQVINTGVEANTRVAVRSVKHSTTTTAAKHAGHTM